MEPFGLVSVCRRFRKACCLRNQARWRNRSDDRRYVSKKSKYPWLLQAVTVTSVRHQMNVSGEIHAQAASLPRKELRYPQNRMLDGREGLSERFGKRFSCFQKSIDRLWGPSRRLFNGNSWHFPSGHGGQGVNLTTHLYLMRRLRMSRAIPTFSQMLSWRAKGELCVFLRTVTEVKLWKINGWNGARGVITLRSYIAPNDSFVKINYCNSSSVVQGGPVSLFHCPVLLWVQVSLFMCILWVKAIRWSVARVLYKLGSVARVLYKLGSVHLVQVF